MPWPNYTEAEKAEMAQKKSIAAQQEAAAASERTASAIQEGNAISREQLEEMRRQTELSAAANDLAEESNAIMRETAAMQQEFNEKSLDVNNKMLATQEEQLRRERTKIPCTWCGREMAPERATRYLDAMICGIQCKNHYREQLIKDNRLIFCENCGCDLVDEVADRDYDKLPLGSFQNPEGKKTIVTIGMIRKFDREDLIAPIAEFLDGHHCCSPKCNLELLIKQFEKKSLFDESVSQAKIIFVYNLAMSLMTQCIFQYAAELFMTISTFQDAQKKADECIAFVKKYDELIAQSAKIADPEIAASKKIIPETNANQLITEQESRIEKLKQARAILTKIPVTHRKYRDVEKRFQNINDAIAVFSAKIEKVTKSQNARFIFWTLVIIVVIVVLALTGK